MQTRNCRPAPIVENTRGVDQDVTLVVDLLAGCEVFSSNIPTRVSIVPGRGGDLMACFDVLMQSVFVLFAISAALSPYGHFK
jgi:hypothetical protein